MNSIIQLFNNNQGVIEVIGLFFVIPLTIISERMIERRRMKNQRKEIREILLKELWVNTNFVSQLEDSYFNNLNDSENLHVPHYSPRIEILEKYFNFDLLSSLNKKEKEGFIEIYSQLLNLKNEYIEWKKLLNANPNIILDHIIYKARSSTMLSYVDPLMRNILEVWLQLVRRIGSKSDIKQIQELNNIIVKLIRDRKWIRTSYKSSFFNRPEYVGINKFDVILCWKHDWTETTKEVIEVKNIVALHESWKK